MGSLHRLLLAEGRSVEAAQYEQRLLTRRERDPYYWLGLGIVQLRQGQPAQAVESLEQAQSLSNGFEEVHHHLAIAYGRTGQLHKARDQMAVLGGLGRGPSGLAQLGKKFQQAPDTPPRQ